MVKLAYRQIQSFIQSPDPDIRAILVYGPDEGQVREAINSIGKTVVDDLNDPFNVADFTASVIQEDPARLADEMSALSMMGGRRLVRIRDAGDKITNTVRTWLKDADGENLALFQAGELGTRSSLRKLFETDKRAAAVPCYVDDIQTLTRFIQTTLRESGYSVDRDAMAYLSQNLVGDRGIQRSELAKLMIYMADQKNITLEDAMAAVGNNAEISLDRLTAAAASGQPHIVSRELASLFSEGVTPVYVLRVLQSYFRRLHITRVRMDKGEHAEAAMKQLHPPVFWKNKDPFQAQLRRWPVSKISRVLDELGRTEAECKKTGYPDETLCERVAFVISRMA